MAIETFADHIIKKARRSELEREIEWFEEMLVTLKKGEVADAIYFIEGAIKTRKREIENL